METLQASADTSSTELPRVRTYFYYIRDETSYPTVTVCIQFDTLTGWYSRGVAVCSRQDQPVKKIGRTIAEYRANLGLHRGNDYPIIRWEILPRTALLFLYDNHIRWKAEANPTLTEHEQRMVSKLLNPNHKMSNCESQEI